MVTDDRQIEVVRNFLDGWDSSKEELPSVKLVWDLIIGLGLNPANLIRDGFLNRIGITWECWNEECSLRFNYGFESKCKTCGSLKIVRGERNDAEYWDSAYRIFDARVKAGHNPQPDSISGFMREVWISDIDKEIRFKPEDVVIVVAEYVDGIDGDKIGVYILRNGLYAMVKQKFIGEDDDKYVIEFGIAATFDHIFRHYVKDDAKYIEFSLNDDNEFVGY